MPSLALPLEGVTLEYLAKPIQAVFLQPILTGALLLARLLRPQELDTFCSKIHLDAATFTKAVNVLFVASVLRVLNKKLTKRVLNNSITDTSWDWHQEIVLVTGGCSGIGELVARKLYENDVRVVIFDVVKPRSPLPPGVTFLEVDITSSEEIHKAAEKIRKEVGEPSVLVNNAGVGHSTPILDTTERQIRQTFDVNIVAHFLLVREFVPHMVKQNHGHIVTMASLASFMVHASNVDYACTKAAALAFHEGLASELKSRYKANKVRTTVVHPTWVRTPLIDHLTRSGDFNEFVLEPVTVANAVVAQILKGEGAQLILPGRFAWLTWVRGFPSWLQQGLRNSVAELL